MEKFHAFFINVTTDLASQTLIDRGEAASINILGYNSSKTANNSLTLSLGKKFCSDGPEIFGVTPEFTTTDLNGNTPIGKTIVEGAKIITDYELSKINYNGKILNEKGIMPY